MIMDKWLSIIVPIYNAEKYLAECVDSLLDQNFDKELYEIILYDDGSKDGSLSIAQDYALRYSNIRVFTHPNAGVSATRNAGLDEAEGEYVWFVDNDDKIVKDVLSLLHEWTERTKVDILLFDSFRFNETGIWKNGPVIRETSIQSGRKSFLDKYIDPCTWNKLLLRSFVKGNDLYFAQKYLEDSEWGTRCFFHAKRVKTIAVCVLYYRVFSSSFSHDNRNKKMTLEEGLLPCLERHYEYMLSHPDPGFWMRALVLDLRRIHCIGMGDARVLCTKEEQKGYLKKEREICRRIIAKLPFSFRIDYWIILICAFCPSLIECVQRYLRNLKWIVNR